MKWEAGVMAYLNERSSLFFPNKLIEKMYTALGSLQLSRGLHTFIPFGSKPKEQSFQRIR